MTYSYLKALGGRQQEVYDYVYGYWKTYHCSPTVTEITLALGLDKAYVSKTLSRIADKGYIEVIPYRRGSIRLLRDANGLDITEPL